MKKFILIIFLIILNLNSYQNQIIKPNINLPTLYEQYISDSTYYYNLAIEHIKECEGFVDTIYLCPANIKTIGYGIQDSTTIGRISKSEGERRLYKSFNYFLKRVSKDYGYDYSINKRIALACFSYNLGETKLKNSELYSLLKNNLEIDTSIVKFVYYKDVRGKIKYSENLKNRRLFELKIFKNKS